MSRLSTPALALLLGLAACGSSTDTAPTPDGVCTPTEHWHDGDGDGWGAGEPITGCTVPDGRVTRTGDCDDGDGAVHPDATEQCDDVDHDCDGDTLLGASGLTSFFADTDGDGHGDPAVEILACGPGAGLSETSDDCDDRSAIVYPGAPEVCDGAQNDCDAAAWDPTDEDGGATWVSGGTPEVLTGALGDRSWSGDGTLYLCAGTYRGRLAFDSGLVDVVGVGGAGSVVLDGEGLGRAISVTDGRLGLTGLTVRGGGVALQDSNGRVTDCVLTDNHPTGEAHGGALSADGGTLTVVRTEVRGNSAVNDRGGGIYAVDGLTLQESEVRDNVATQGGGVFAYQLSVADSVISGNRAEWGLMSAWGGGISAAGTVNLLRSEIRGNDGGGRGGGLWFQNGNLNITDTSFVDNTASNGGGVFADASNGGNTVLDATGMTLQGNVASGEGGGMWWAGCGSCSETGHGGPLEIANSTIVGNSAEWGGGLYMSSWTLRLVDTVVEGNTATRWGGGAYVFGDSSMNRTFACYGLLGSPAGFLDNEGFGLVFDEDTWRATFTACDFGEGAQDNAPLDLVFDRYGYGNNPSSWGFTKGDDESFECAPSTACE